MTVLVTGAAGFVGRNVVERLRREGTDLVATDIAESPYGDDLNYVRANILDEDDVDDLVSRVDTVIHLAASPMGASLENPKMNLRVNVEGTLNIMEAALEHDVDRVIYSSASSVVGEVEYNPVDEDHPCTPKTPYAITKKTGEDYLRVYNEIHDLDYLVFRFFNIYGPHQHPDSGALIPMIHRMLSGGETFTVFGDGSQTRDFVYIEDLADFFHRALESDARNEVVNLGTGEATSILELVELSGEVLGVDPDIERKPERPGEIDNFVADTTKIEKLFNKTPDTSVRKGLTETFEWLEAGK